MSAAFWIGADGSVISIDQTHILAVIRDPERFGETRASIQGEYARFNEPIPCERHAREVILRRVIERSWIRVRRYRDHWAATVWKDNQATRARVESVARGLLQGFGGVRECDRFAPLRMSAIGEPAERKATLNEWATGLVFVQGTGAEDRALGTAPRLAEGKTLSEKRGDDGG